jgi:branched-chain amino acid transport system ATP-binding protein
MTKEMNEGTQVDRNEACEPIGTSDAPFFEVKNLVAGYGDIRAVWDVSLSVKPGYVTALLGPNGAGKTTTVLAIAGLARTFGGSIHAGGVDLHGLPPYERAIRARLSVVQEGKRIFRNRTVEQNLRIGLWPLRREGRRAHAAALATTYEQFPILADRRTTRAGLLSGGQQQILAIAQALVWTPSVLILDEPSIGLAPVIVQDVLKIVQGLKERGIGVLLVEQLVGAALTVADDVVVINGGRVAASGTVAEVGSHEDIRNIYLGAVEDV